MLRLNFDQCLEVVQKHTKACIYIQLLSVLT